jgi:hypothetical protein
MPKTKIRYRVNLIVSGKWREEVDNLTLPKAFVQVRTWLQTNTSVEVTMEKQSLSV